MTIQLSTKTIFRSLLFVAIVVAVLSVAMLVEARDLPANAAAASDTVTTTTDTTPVVADAGPTFLPMEDIADGLASWYGQPFHGRRTASGRRFDMNEFTAAHRTLPFGSLVRVVNPTTGKTIVVEITDRGPFIRRRVLDLSKAAARELGISVSPVEIEALTPAAIREFYLENDSTVLALDSEMSVRIVDREDLVGDTTSSTFTEAFQQRDSLDVIVIVPTEKSLRYRRMSMNDQFAVR